MSSAGEKDRSPDRRPRDRSMEPEEAEVGVSGQGPKFFLAVFQGGMREPRIYRAYPDAEGISFLYAGPAPVFLDVELARGKDQGDWKVKAAGALKAGFVSAAGGAIVVGAVVIAILGRLALRDGSNVTDLIALVLGLGAMFAVAIILVLTTSVRKITKRVNLLNTMSPDELREEAENEKWCFRATARNVSDVRIDPHEESGAGKPKFSARLSFRHDPTGKWKLNLVKPKDTRAAARAFRNLLGKEEVDVNVSLKKE